MFVLGADGTIHIGALESLGNDSALFNEILVQATKALFDRSPVGLENMELVQRVFSNSAIQKINADVAWEMHFLKSRNIRSWALPSNIDFVKRDKSGGRIYQIKGQLTIAGNYKGTAIADSEQFTVIMQLERNPRYADQARYPFYVTDFYIAEPKRPAKQP